MWPSLWSFQMGMKNLRDFCEGITQFQYHQHSSLTTPLNPYNHCDNPHVAHLKREREKECKCRVHWLEGVENSWLKQCAMGSNSFEVVSFKFHYIFTKIPVKSLCPKSLKLIVKRFLQIVRSPWGAGFVN